MFIPYFQFCSQEEPVEKQHREAEEQFMTNKDIRWIQRFSNYSKALRQLEKAVILAGERELSELERQGIVQAFEYTHELAWNTLKDFLEHRGNRNIYGSKDATREAFRLGLIEDGDTWMDMIMSRNQASHTYNEETAEEIANDIQNRYFDNFVLLQKKFSELKDKEQH